MTSENSCPGRHSCPRGMPGKVLLQQLLPLMDSELSDLNVKSYVRPCKIDFFSLGWLLYPLETQAYFLIELDPSNFQTKWISEDLKG